MTVGTEGLLSWAWSHMSAELQRKVSLPNATKTDLTLRSPGGDLSLCVGHIARTQEVMLCFQEGYYLYPLTRDFLHHVTSSWGASPLSRELDDWLETLEEQEPQRVLHDGKLLELHPAASPWEEWFREHFVGTGILEKVFDISREGDFKISCWHLGRNCFKVSMEKRGEKILSYNKETTPGLYVIPEHMHIMNGTVTTFEESLYVRYDVARKLLERFREKLEEPFGIYSGVVPV